MSSVKPIIHGPLADDMVRRCGDEREQEKCVRGGMIPDAFHPPLMQKSWDGQTTRRADPGFADPRDLLPWKYNSWMYIDPRYLLPLLLDQVSPCVLGCAIEGTRAKTSCNLLHHKVFVCLCVCALTLQDFMTKSSLCIYHIVFVSDYVAPLTGSSLSDLKFSSHFTSSSTSFFRFVCLRQTNCLLSVCLSVCL